jgi:hypothetical protein
MKASSKRRVETLWEANTNSDEAASALFVWPRTRQPSSARAHSAASSFPIFCTQSVSFYLSLNCVQKRSWVTEQSAISPSRANAPAKPKARCLNFYRALLSAALERAIEPDPVDNPLSVSSLPSA